MTRRLGIALLGVVVVATACGGDDSAAPPTTAGLSGSIVVEAPSPKTCDPVDPRDCLLPFPSDFHTVAAPGNGTHRQVAFARATMPANADGVHVDPAELNRNDGFSPGSAALTYVPGVDLTRTGAAAVGDIGASLADDSPTVIVDATTRKRVAHWAEMDSTQKADPGLLQLQPARNHPDGHRIIVALRRMKDATGKEIAPSDAFRAYRDRLDTDDPSLEVQRARYEAIFGDLDAAGIDRADLYLAWDFTVASTRNLTERVLHMRDDAFRVLDDAAPAFTVTSSEPVPDDSRLARIVRGTFEVPLYMTGAGAAGERLTRSDDGGLPERTGTYTAPFMCTVPAHAGPLEPTLYGHGLLGSEEEVDAGNIRDMTNEHGRLYCATRWIGMSEEDIPNAVSSLGDLSKFPSMVDRMQQGMVNALFLGRLMIHGDGLVTDPAFQGASGEPLIDGSELYYDSNSQGAIMGGALTALSTDFTRSVLGVPGMNYSTLLRRSSDWDTYRAVYDPAYPDELDRTLGLHLAQMLWDRGEADGYANHMTDDPLPGTPRHTVLMHVAYGDHQVAPVTANVEARTIGAAIHAPIVSSGRNPDDPYWHIPILRDGSRGSAIVIWDSGSPDPPVGNIAPSTGHDPHEDPRADAAARRQKAAFLAPGGMVVDGCDGAPCTAQPTD